MKEKKFLKGILRIWIVCLAIGLISAYFGQFQEQKLILIVSAIVLPFYYVIKIYWLDKEKTSKA